MTKMFTIASVSLVLAAAVVNGCSSSDDDNKSSSQPSDGKTCNDLQACCAKVSNADDKKICQEVHDALIGVQNADLGCSNALKSGWSAKCP